MNSSFRSIDPVELWARRHLALMLAIREVKTRYKQSMLGFIWAIARPLIQVIVFTYLFGSVAKLPSGTVPYPLFVFSALLAWDLFSNIVQGCAASIISHRVVVERVYCPRLIFLVSAVFVALFDFAVSVCVFLVLMLLYGVMPSLDLIWMPLILMVVVLSGLSIGLWLAAAAVWMRDIKFIVSYVIQLMMLLTPVGYGGSAVPEQFRFLVDMNPMAIIVEAFRWCILGLPGPVVGVAMLGGGIICVLLVGGMLFFNSLERSFADVI